MRPPCKFHDERVRCARCAPVNSRVEITSTGVDEVYQNLGSDPYGGISAVGLRVPAVAGTSPRSRYLFNLCGFRVADGATARVRGFRHGWTLGFAQENLIAGTRRVVEQWVTDPTFQVDGGSISWHLRVMGLNEPVVPNPGAGPIQPALRNFAFRASDTPALLYQAATFPAGVPIFYTQLTAYTPPFAGQPNGRALGGELGSFYDLKTDWRTPDAWHALDIPVVGPARVVFFASVQQRDLQKSVALVVPNPTDFPLAVPAEEQFLQKYPNANIWRVAGALSVDLGCEGMNP